MTQSVVVPSADGPVGGRRSRRRALVLVAAAVVVVLVAGALVAARQVVPGARGTGSYSVYSDSIEVVTVAAPAQDPTHLATFTPGARVTLLFALSSFSRVPLRVDEVFPSDRALGCGWVPDRVSTGEVGSEAPFAPFWLSGEESVQLSVSGVFDCAGRSTCCFGVTAYTTVPVRYSVGGVLSRTTEVSLPYAFGWGDDPEQSLAEVVTRQPPVTVG